MEHLAFYEISGFGPKSENISSFFFWEIAFFVRFVRMVHEFDRVFFNSLRFTHSANGP